MLRDQAILPLLSLCVGFTLLHISHSFLIPGVAPTEYKACDSVPVMGVKLTSSRTQLPYEYYSLPLCKPLQEDTEYKSENLGEVLRGDRIVTTSYTFNMGVNQSCVTLCKVSLTPSDQKQIHQMIRQNYHVHLLTDNLPLAVPYVKTNGNVQYDLGYLLGMESEDKKVYIHNHLQFTMKYHLIDGLYRVVGFEVQPVSMAATQVKSETEPKLPDQAVCKDKKGLKPVNQCVLNVKDQSTWIFEEIVEKPTNPMDIYFTYSVNWEKSELKWASRWDTYLAMSNPQIHWFSILNSIVVILFLAGVLTAIIYRTLKKDIALYNRDDEELEEALEESGWKLVHGDVFRAPKHSMVLSSLIGTGVQLIGLTTVLIFFAALGMLSPASRGALMTAAILVYVFMGILAGFYAGRMYKTLKGLKWKRAAFMTSTLYPLIILGCGFFMNFFIWGKKSSGAIPFTTMIALLALWFGISVPLVFFGYYFGYRKQPYDHPVRTNQIPRQIPEQQWFLRTLPAALLAGILPFGAMFIELFFIFSALWQNQFYYLFGFLFLVYVILMVACSQISIVMVYFQLCAEDYQWWWKSFVVSGGSAIYLFAYSTFYYFNRLEIVGFIPTLLYFVYSFLMAFSFWILTGTIGFYAAYAFIRKIYGAIKID